MQTISIGTQSFEKIREKNSFYIDKSLLIKEWWESQDDVTLITRPRRFGKTLNLDMLNCFFSKGYENRGDLFEGLAIWEEEEYRDMQGSYPVIFLSFAGIKGTSYEVIRGAIIQILIDLYDHFRFLWADNRLSDTQKSFFHLVNQEMTDDLIGMALHRLSICLNQYYGKKVLIFLDEYDTPLQEAYIYGYWEKLVALTRSLFNCTFKTNPYLERALMTGITRVSKESIFSDLNNVKVVTTTSESYETQFGFTEEEVFHSLDLFGMSAEKGNVKHWYDGFTFGKQRGIYNPWSITNFLDSKRFAPYWSNTSSNGLINVLIRQGEPEIKTTMEDLMAGKAFLTETDEEVIFSQLSTRKEALWGLLLACGYLKVEESFFRPERRRYSYRLSLTNEEVTLMFEDMIHEWFAAPNVPYNAFLRALLLGDVEAMNHYMNKIALSTFSFFDTGNQPSEYSEPERFYHGFVLGLIVELSEQYQITSNRESGFGRYDVMMEPIEKDKPAFVLEFKVRSPQKETSLQDTLANALEQIENKHYDTKLTSHGIPKEQIRHYGFAFEGKNVLIG